MMQRIRDLAFVAFMCLVLFSPGANFATSFFQRVTPKSALEGRERPKFPEITLLAIARGETQSALDAALSFSAPNRDNALLAHAKWQRLLIDGAADLFGFAAYPTFYGSGLCRIEGQNVITPIPGKFRAKRAKRLVDAARHYAGIVEAFPEIGWFFALIDRPGYSQASPLHGFVNSPLDYGVYRKYFLAKLPGRYRVVDLGYAESEDLYTDFFGTDHHWRIQGALRAYGRIADALGIKRIRHEPPAPVTSAGFLGSYARLGLDADARGEAVYDVAYAGSPLRVEVNGRQRPEYVLDYGYRKIPFRQFSRFENIYGRWFHNNFKSLHIINDRVERGVLVIVGDSFANCMERFFAESYREVHKLDVRFIDMTLAEFLASRHVDDVLFLFGPNATAKDTLEFLRVGAPIPEKKK